MLQFKVGKLEGIAQGLAKIIQAADQRPDVDTGLLYWAFRLSKKLESEMEALMKIKMPTLKRFASEITQQVPGQFTKDEGGKNVPVMRGTGRWNFNSPEDKEKFDKEMEETMNEEVKIDANIYKKTFEDVLKLKLGGTILFELEAILEEAVKIKKDTDDKEHTKEGIEDAKVVK